MAAALIGGLLLLAFVLLRADRGDGGAGSAGEGAAASPDTAVIRRLPLPVLEFLAECGEDRDLSDEPIRFQAELSGCIDRMTTALGVILEGDTARAWLLDQQFEAHRENTRRILQQQGESLQTAPAREMLSSAGLLLAHLWEARYSTVRGLAQDVAEARRAARRLDDRRPLFDQRDTVEEVLDRTADALLRMAGEEIEPPGQPSSASSSPAGSPSRR